MVAKDRENRRESRGWRGIVYKMRGIGGPTDKA